MTTYLRTSLSLSATLALTVSLVPPAFSQGAPGLTGTLSFSQGFELSDNADLDPATSGSTFTTRTGLSFSLDSQTTTETFQFRVGTQAVGDYGGGGSDEIDLENTDALLSYSRSGADSVLSFSAGYSEVQLDDSVISFGLGGGFSPATLVISDGIAEITTIDANLQTGLNAPFGFDIGAGYFKEDFSNTTDPSLIDNESIYIDTVTRFQINPSRTVRLLAGLSQDKEVGSPDTDSSYIGLGVLGSTAGNLDYSGDVIFDRSESASVVDDGLGIVLSATQQRPDGQFGADLSSRTDDSGRRTEATINRRITMSTGELSFTLGAVDQEGDSSIRPKGSVNYRRDALDGALTASLSRDPVEDSGSYYNNTSLSVDYSKSINATSGWSAQLSYDESDQIGGTDDDDRTTAQFTYTRSLTNNWQMNTGLQHTRESISSGSTESSNTIFLNVQRDVTFGF